MNVSNDLVSAVGHSPGNALREQEHSHFVRLQDEMLRETMRPGWMAGDLMWPALGTVNIFLPEICWWAGSVGDTQSPSTQYN